MFEFAGKQEFGTVTEMMVEIVPGTLGIKLVPAWENPKGRRVPKAQVQSFRSGVKSSQSSDVRTSPLQLGLPYDTFGTRWKRHTGNVPLMPGSQQNPFLIDWPKPAWIAYPKLYFGKPRSKTSQDDLKNLRANDPAIKEFLPSGGTLSGGESIGIQAPYRIGKGSVIGPLSSATTPGGEKLAVILKRYGYHPDVDPMQVDHVHEIQLGGKDVVENLWPLATSINSKAGSTIAGCRVRFPDGSGDVPLRDLKRLSGTEFYFEIEKTE
jgi:5-methylcytosine-specific restriction endonuclease McrA